LAVMVSSSFTLPSLKLAARRFVRGKKPTLADTAAAAATALSAASLSRKLPGVVRSSLTSKCSCRCCCFFHGNCRFRRGVGGAVVVVVVVSCHESELSPAVLAVYRVDLVLCDAVPGDTGSSSSTASPSIEAKYRWASVLLLRLFFCFARSMSPMMVVVVRCLGAHTCVCVCAVDSGEQQYPCGCCAPPLGTCPVYPRMILRIYAISTLAPWRAESQRMSLIEARRQTCRASFTQKNDEMDG
jgi:hypothetical protein